MNALTSFEAPMTALVQGASRGIGLGLVRALLANARVDRVIATCRKPEAAQELNDLHCDRLLIAPLDVTKTETIEQLVVQLKAEGTQLNLAINAAGILHSGDLMPEKKLEDLDSSALQQVFAVNTFGPILVFKALRPLMTRQGKAVMCAISARVGSISDNRLGGWYTYRASKAGLNQLLKTAAIELKRRNKNVIVAALHPGTTDTGLSRPFQSRVPEHKLFSVEQTTDYLLDVIDSLDEDDSGGFFAWDGQAIEW